MLKVLATVWTLTDLFSVYLLFCSAVCSALGLISYFVAPVENRVHLMSNCLSLTVAFFIACLISAVISHFSLRLWQLINRN
jgi:hypothetical protein